MKESKNVMRYLQWRDDGNRRELRLDQVGHLIIS